ncbi:MAG: sulfotransferase family protein [Aeoliella sp.]
MPAPTSQPICLDRETPDAFLPSNLTNPYVFLVGSPRSGTTMLKRMVSAHPLITISRETHWVPHFYERRKGVDADGLVTPAIVDKLFSHHRFSQMKMSAPTVRDVVTSHPGITYAGLVTSIFDHYARRRDKPLAGDKTPKYVRKLPTLWELWPATRVLHIIRDGRSVWLSMRNWRMAHKAAGQFSTWQESPVVTTALWWKALVGIGVEDGRRQCSDQYAEISYEHLVANPELGCRRIAAFLGLEYNEAMPNYFRGKTRRKQEASANAAWLPPTPGLRDWRTDMTADEVQQFEWAAGDLLHAYDYEISSPEPKSGVRQRLEAIKDRFTEEVLGRGWRLPIGW